MVCEQSFAKRTDRSANYAGGCAGCVCIFQNAVCRTEEDFIYFTGVKCVPGNSLHVCNLSDYQDSESVEFLYGIGIYLCGKYGDFCFLEYEGIFFL